MPELFPPEILNYSAENYYNKLSVKSKIIYLSILLFLGLAAVSLPFIHIDITTQNRGIVRSPHENTLIQSAVYAQINLFDMAENKSVTAGDTLLLLNTEQLDEQIMAENKKKQENLDFIKDLSNIQGNANNILTPKYISEYKRYLSGIKEQNVLIDFLKKECDVSKKLYEKAVISEFEYLQKRNDLEKGISSLTTMRDEYFSNWQSEQTRLLFENQILESHIKQLEKEKRQYMITAPISGTLMQVAGFYEGNFIVPNQPLAYISSADSLLVECYIAPKDIGYLKVGQSIVFQIDAFNYREWGLIKGEIAEILNDVVTVQNQPVFRVRCRPHTSCLKLKNGYEGCLKKGMTLTGRFHLTNRTLWQLLFDKVDDWMNPKMMNY